MSSTPLNLESWQTPAEIRTYLESISEEKHRLFTAKLIPTIDSAQILGIRMPIIRNLAKRLAKENPTLVKAFMADVPHRYHEEDLIHTSLFDHLPDFHSALTALDTFRPYITNWATCDSVRLPLFKKHTAELLPYVYRWLKSEEPYTIRLGLLMLLNYYTQDKYEAEHLDYITAIHNDDYYVKMGMAWYLSMVLVHHYDEVLAYLKENHLSPWVHNKTIQKAVESYQLSDDQKVELKMLKRK